MSEISRRYRCRFCGRPLGGSREAPFAAIKHGFFDHSPTGRWIRDRYLDTTTDHSETDDNA